MKTIRNQDSSEWRKVGTRATADLNAVLVGVVEGNDVIEVLKPPAEARAKIGVNGQWTKLRMPDDATEEVPLCH